MPVTRYTYPWLSTTTAVYMPKTPSNSSREQTAISLLMYCRFGVSIKWLRRQKSNLVHRPGYEPGETPFLDRRETL
jgi:hypothetical protein